MASGVGKTGVSVRVTLPDAVDGTDSREFAVPEGMVTMVVHVPSLVGTGATLKLQTKAHQLTDDESASWVDIDYMIDDGSFTALDGLLESTTVVIPVLYTGPGPLRFVASEAQTGAVDAITVRVTFGR
jgi:hypothetical protein